MDFSVYKNEDGLPYVRAAKQRIAEGLQFTLDEGGIYRYGTEEGKRN